MGLCLDKKSSKTAAIVFQISYHGYASSKINDIEPHKLLTTKGIFCARHKHDADDDDQHIEFAGGKVQLITTKDSWDQKLSEASRDGKIVLANFSATWCGPCRQIAPLYSELSEKYPSLLFLLVDVDELSDFSTSWEIKATPTFFFLRDGQQVDKLVGANKPELQKKITAIVDSIPPRDK
ncbi:hypothetical protein OIU77_030279 [Salix suchowensis]|uniref:Thioredoxin domain-containing protein n=1 Tax=Salix suchowensis TaxID=1278906 RepID=A0ABQ9BDH8_9ROSI|nr:hypothetical protein OIU77_030279 [Salix suchowensis]